MRAGNCSLAKSHVWRINIQDSKSLRYFSDLGAWITDEAAARDFERVHLALEYCAAHDLKDVHVVLAARPSGSNRVARTILRLPPARTKRPPAGESLPRNDTG